MRRLRCCSLLVLICVVCLVTTCARPAPTPTPESDGSAKPVESSAPATLTPVPSPSPAYPGVYTGTPTLNPTPAGFSNDTGVESYVVQRGETLSLIAAVFGCTIEEIVAANGLPDENSIRAGQTLIIPTTATETGPVLKLIPDSELVYGPAYIHFDLEGFVAGQGGYLATYTEEVEGSLLTGAEIVQLVSQRFGVGPRVLLTLLELRAGWVTEPQPAVGARSPRPYGYPLGQVQSYHEGLFQQLSWAAVRL
ncbi:MAG: hypothetical protein DRI77_14935, partial [Chloroflexi bacterium]